jgi:hypothetical protein
VNRMCRSSKTDVATDAEQVRRRPAIESTGHRARWPQALLPAAGSRRHHGFGFGAVAFTFMTLVAFTTVPGARPRTRAR